jgi:hypothetical protein
MEKNQNIFLYIRIKSEFKLEVENKCKLNSVLKKQAWKTHKKCGSKSPRIPKVGRDTCEL